MKAFVDATPISGPACVITRPSDSRAIVEPITLQRPIVRHLSSLRASRAAAIVSAVSPDWLIAMTALFDVEDRVPVPELGGVVDLDRDPRELLEEELRHEAGVPRRPARDERDAVRACGARRP